MKHLPIKRYVVPAVMTVFILSATFGIVRAADKVSYEKCLTCHEALKTQLQEKGAHVPFKDFDCGSCHESHTSNQPFLIKTQIGEICRQCHEEQTEHVRFSHAPVEDGNCIACHVPHASSESNLLKTKGKELCFSCHSKDALFAGSTRHDPATKGQCMKCHSPHGSEFASILVKDKAQICSSCHATDNTAMKTAHLGYTVAGTQCVSCHNPHGSSGKKLVRSHQHKPFAAKNCNACHAAPDSQKPAQLKETSTQACLECHKKTGPEFEKVNSHVQNGLFCTDCHNPHASDYSGLTVDAQDKTCYRCHQDTMWRITDKKANFQHPEVKKGNCVACHSPHGSDERSFLIADEQKLCTGCHKRHATFTHPIGETAIDPRSKRDINCTTCHDLKGSPYEYAMHLDRKKQLCIQCHTSY